MKTQFTTKQLARALGVNYEVIVKAIFLGRLIPPPKIGSAYLWDRKSIEQASWILRRKDASDIFPQVKGTTEGLVADRQILFRKLSNFALLHFIEMGVVNG